MVDQKSEAVIIDVNEIRKWIGKTDSRSDQVTLAPITALSATLDRDDPPPQAGDPLPPLWHWLYFLPTCRASEIAPDGHAERGGFLPPIPLPRRMWAGSRFRFHHPIRAGETIHRTSRILDVTQKEGRTGPLIFVVARHEISNSQGMALVEEQDLVYRDHAKPGDPTPKPQTAPQNCAWSREICPNEVLLFRYSALTFNGHRIHYDRKYATEVEGYPGLVVHGPLLATLLLDLLRRNLPRAVVSQFVFRAIRPLFDTASFRVCAQPEEGGKTVTLWAQDAEGWLATQGTVTLA